MREVAPGIRVVPVRTPTLPPATHTNTYVVGDGDLSLFDPASPWPEEQALLLAAVQARLDRGERAERIVLTHHHADHVGGAVALRDALDIPIVAHPETSARVPFSVDEAWEDGETKDCGGRRLRAYYTPGHAPGHLVFQDLDSRATIAGDMVAGVGTIVIEPEDGHLGDYLASLEKMRTLDASVLLPAHGEPLPHAEALLSFYIAHRHQRTDQIRTALDQLGIASPLDLAPVVYPELEPAIHPLAAVQILSHLLWLSEAGQARQVDDVEWTLSR